jgi:hypothetical protein
LLLLVGQGVPVAALPAVLVGISTLRSSSRADSEPSGERASELATRLARHDTLNGREPGAAEP